MMFGGLRVDAAFAHELIRAVEPMAIEAALLAERRKMERQAEHRRILDLELQQARYEASLAERRYAACDPDNRLIAATLEKNWETALRRVHDCEARLDPITMSAPTPPMPDLNCHRRGPRGGMEEHQRHHALPPATGAGPGQRDHRRYRRGGARDRPDHPLERRTALGTAPAQAPSGEHACSTSDDALAVIRSMASRWSDQDIAATLNRMALPTGQGKTWTAHRVGSIRRVRDIHAYRSAEKDGDWLTLREAAQRCGVTSHQDS